MDRDYFAGAGFRRRSWKSKLKSVAGETAFMVARSIEPSGVKENVI